MNKSPVEWLPNGYMDEVMPDGRGSPDATISTDFRATVATTIRDAFKLKKVMISKSLRAARAPCPVCGGELQGRLAGPKNHMRFWCTGTCGREMME